MSRGAVVPCIIGCLVFRPESGSVLFFFTRAAAFLLARASLVACTLAACELSSAAELEQTIVTGRKPAAANGEHLHGFNSYTAVDEMLVSPVSLAEIVNGQPGVAFTGQGGLFQTVSVRGLSRQRVGNFFLDIPLLSERRAGTAASFIDPSLLSSVELVRGPATTAYGSGNIGGLIRSLPGVPMGVQARLGWGGSGNENSQLLAAGNGAGYLALTHRGSNNAETTAGAPLHTEFEQYNFLAGGHHDTAQASYDLVSLLTYGHDIGKSNVRFPEQRVTSYPRERHWLSQLTRHADGYTGNVFFHSQDLETAVLQPAETLDTVVSSSLDFGARYASDWHDRDDWRWGVEYLGRRDVESEEWQTRVGQPRGPGQQTLDAAQDELAIFLEGRREWRQVTATAGLRFTGQRQDARGWSSVSEQLWSGYLGAAWVLDPAWRMTAELSRGARVANLSEKFFSGTTGRGSVVGNPKLQPETADSLDLGLVRETTRSRLELHVFHLWLNEFIERVDLGGDELGFRNLDGGRIEGVDFIAGWTLEPGWELKLGGHYQDGEDRSGAPLQDVSPNQLSAGLAYRGAHWEWSLEYRHRFAKSRVAEGEQAVDSADLVSLVLGRSLSANLSITFWGRNLLDQSYLITTDELSTDGEKAAFGVELFWRSGGA